MCDETLSATAQVHLRELRLKIMVAESDKDREGTFLLGGGGGLGNFDIFFSKKCWLSLAF